MEEAKRVEKSTIFGNWVDRIGYPITTRILPFVARFSFITPNVVTISSFLLYLLACLLLVIKVPNWSIFSAVLFVIAYMGDQLDGQLSRFKNMTSDLGDYLDKTLDVIKIYAIMLSVGLSVYYSSGEYIHIILGLTAAFFFNFRYYIKLETVLKKAMIDRSYLETCSRMQETFEKEILKKHKALMKGGIFQKIKGYVLINGSIFFVDEGEFAFFAAIGALFNRLDLILYIFVISQISIALFRWVQRGYQLVTHSNELLKPLRK